VTDPRVPDGWPWGAPPFFALIRGPLPGSGYQVASVERSDEPESRTVLLFSCPEKAEKYGQARPQGFSDWKVGPLPNWERLEFFLGSLGEGVRFLSVDVENPVDRDDGVPTMLPPADGDFRVSLESVLRALGRDEDA